MSSSDVEKYMDLESSEDSRAPIEEQVETLDETLELWKSSTNIQPKEELAKKKKALEAKRERNIKNFSSKKTHKCGSGRWSFIEMK